MNCADFEPLVNAWVDSELAADQKATLREHVEECAHCTALVESVRSSNRELETLFAEPAGKLADIDISSIVTLQGIDAGANIHGAAPSATHSTSSGPSSAVASVSPTSQVTTRSLSGVPRSSLVAWICAAAAALLVLAFSWDRPGDSGGPNVFAAQPAARLVVATGEVTMKDPQQAIIACAPQAQLPDGWVVITGENSRCELSNAAEMPIRLDQNSELKHLANNTVRLEKGRMWASTKQDFCLESPAANVATKNATFDFSCAPGTSDTVLNVYEGEVDVTSADGGNMQVRAGQSVQFGNWGMRSVKTADPVLGTRWINDLLVKKGQEDQELIERVEWLWIQITAKNPDQAAAYETELRTLGSCAVRPLCDWVQSSASLSQPSKRAEAAKLLSDLAGPDAIPRLIDLLEDDDGDVRFHAAVALERLTGESHGGTPEQWRALPTPLRQKARGSWNNWWDDKTKDG